MVGRDVEHYNWVRSQSGLGYEPLDRLEARHAEIVSQRDRKLEHLRRLLQSDRYGLM